MLPVSSAEALCFVNMGKNVEAALTSGEDALRSLGPLQEPAEAEARPVREAVQNLRRLVKKLRFGVSFVRVAAQFGASQANMLGAPAEPALYFPGLSEEQLQFVRDLQREADMRAFRY
jgi:hypothetical protein